MLCKLHTIPDTLHSLDEQHFCYSTSIHCRCWCCNPYSLHTLELVVISNPQRAILQRQTWWRWVERQGLAVTVGLDGPFLGPRHTLLRLDLLSVGAAVRLLRWWGKVGINSGSHAGEQRGGTG